MTHQFLFEIGTEELPVSFVLSALNAWPALCERELAAARLKYDSVDVFGTPRRLALMIHGLASRQADLHERVQGPPKSVAFAPDGSLSRAGQNFVTKLGIDAAALDVVSTPKGDYVMAERHLAGRSAAEVLVELVPNLAHQIPFPKVMRWGEGQHAFGRPVHWLVVLLDAQPLDVEFAGIRADRNSRGHRFLAPAAVTISDATQYVHSLQRAHVVVQGDVRAAAITEQLLKRCGEVKGELVEDANLVKECAYLVEKPHVVAGHFDPAFLDLPEEVIVAVMRGHQRYFAVRNPNGGGLMPAYLTVANTAEDPQNVSRGNDRVLGARLADARFFVREDAKNTLAERVAALDGVVFQAKLGSMGAKVRRLTTLVGALSALTDGQLAADAATSLAQAATLCKADLLTLMVGEFPELQGVMGRWYALNEGVAAPVADALRDHYFPKGAQSPVPTSPLSAILAAADRLDTLVGCFGAGIVPDGSTDPFALRRAALGLVRIASEGPCDFDLTRALCAAYDQYDPGQLKAREETVRQLDAFVRARLRAWYADKANTDVIDACLASWPLSTMGDLNARVTAVQAFRSSADYAVLATAFKRAFNIAKDVVKEGQVTEALLSEPAEVALAKAYQDLQPRLQEALACRAYDRALALAADGLRQPIDRFFDEVFVMDDNPAIRTNRLQLLGNIVHTLTHIADFRALGN